MTPRDRTAREVREPCAHRLRGELLADHHRIWAAHQTISDPKHVEAAKVLRRRHFSVARPATETQVQVRSLADYDAALGVDLDGGVA